MAQDNKGGALKSIADELPLDKLKDEVQHGLGLLGEKAITSIGDRITDLTDRLNDVADGGGVVGKAAKKGTENSIRSAISVAASTPCRYASLTTIAFAENSTLPVMASARPARNWRRADVTPPRFDVCKLATSALTTPPTPGRPIRR